MSRHENKEFTVRNFVCVIRKMRPDEALVETEVASHMHGMLATVAIMPRMLLCGCLSCAPACSSAFFFPQLFPRGALEMYTAKNMGWDVTAEQVQYNPSLL